MKTLFLFVNDENLRTMYEDAVLQHNQSVDNNSFADSGFDLFISNEYDLQPGTLRWSKDRLPQKI